MTLSEKIHNYRLKTGYTQRELAEKADITPAMVCQYERGKLIPSERTMLRIAMALGVDYQVFMTGEDRGAQALSAERTADLFLGPAGEALLAKIKSQAGAWEITADDNGIFTLCNYDGVSATLTNEAAEMLNAEIDRFIDFRLREFCRRKDR